MPATGDGDLDLTASTRGDGGEVTLTLVNRSPDESYAVEIVLDGAGTGGDVRGLLLSSSGFLPGSQFRETPLDLRPAGNHTLRVSMPPHSVARAQFALRPVLPT